MLLNDKTALVTGGAVRLGRAICLELARAGCHLLIHYNHSVEAARTLQQHINALGVRSELLQADLSDSASRDAFIQTVLERDTAPDILVNNASIFFPTPLETVTEEDWLRLERINVRAPFFIARALGLRMRARGNGRIIFIGDTGFRSPWPDYVPYLTGKGAVNTMARGLAKALAPQVLVNTINPGPVLFPDDYTEEQKEKALARTLLKRPGTAEAIAKTVRFLAESDYITGAALPVDGGRHIG